MLRHAFWAASRAKGIKHACVLALVSISFCSCRSATPPAAMQPGPYGPNAGPNARQMGGPGFVPPGYDAGMVPGGAAMTGMGSPYASGPPLAQTVFAGPAAGGCMAGCCSPRAAAPCADGSCAVGAPCAAPIARRPGWDEMLCDGGDAEATVTVGSDFSLRGLDIEDTVVHYDCVDGRTFVQPSNQVCIYAPRFASVRKVDGLVSGEQYDQVSGLILPERLARHDESQGPTTALQPLQPVGQLGIKQGVIFRERLKPEGVDQPVRVVALHDIIQPYAHFEVIKAGIYEQGEKPRLAKAVQSAITWTHDHAVAVIIDSKSAVVETGDRRAEATYRVDAAPCPRLRVCKVASTSDALPGEIVDFTIRFDNIGTTPMGNVTIVDNLTTRLEYVPESALSSRKAEFFTQRNEAESLVLRWEITEPLPPGQGGVVRFKARVR